MKSQIKPRIKAVLFDVGGVLISDIDPPIYAEIARVFGVTPKLQKKALEAGMDGLQRGKVSEQEFWSGVAGCLGMAMPPERTRTLWREMIEKYAVANDEVTGIVQRLRKAGYRTGIVSNTEPSHAAYMRESGLLDGFDPIVLSCESGYVKPESGIFSTALGRLGLPAGQVAYVDDSEARMAGAKELGMRCHKFTSAMSLEKFLAGLGVNI